MNRGESVFSRLLHYMQHLIYSSEPSQEKTLEISPKLALHY